MRENYTGLKRKGLIRSVTEILVILLSSFVTLGSSLYTASTAGLLSSQFTANTYYIANTGNDNNTGTSPDQAWKTISKVNQYGLNPGFQPGDRILFKGGDTFDDAVMIILNSGTESDPVIFSSYGEGKAHLTRSGISHDEIIQILDQKYFTIENLEISNPDFDMAKTTRGIRIEFTKPGDYPGIIIRNNHIHDIHGGMWTNRHLRGGIWMRSRKDVHAYTVDMLVENNLIERCYTRGIKLDAEGTAFHKNMIVRNNFVDNTGQAGIVIGHVEGGLIEGNTVYRAGNYYPEGDQAGVLAACWAANSKNIIIQYNEVAYTKLGDVTRPDGNLNENSHDSQAFDIDVTAPGWHLIQYNYTHDNEGGFFLWMGNPGPDFEWAVIRYNLSVNDGKGFDNRLFELHSNEDNNQYPVYVYNNTFVNDERIWINNRSQESNNHKGWVFENNIFYAPAGQYDDQQSIVYKNNIYWLGEGPVVDSMARHVDPEILNPEVYVEGWEYIDNFQISVGSPAVNNTICEASRHLIDAGQRDIFGHPLPESSRSIGAFERAPRKLDYLISDTVFLIMQDFDLDESFDSVSFYSNDSLLFRDISTPFRYEWVNPSVGTYDLHVVTLQDGVSSTGRHSFTIHVHGYKKAEKPGEVIPGLIREYFEGSWYLLPDFSDLKVVKKETASNFHLTPYDEQGKFACRFTGYIMIQEKGEYSFYLNSKDGSRLFTSDRLLIDHDGIDQVNEEFNSVLLDTGLHFMKVTVFNNTGEAGLDVFFEGPGITKQRIPDSLLFRPRGVPPVISVSIPSWNSHFNEGDSIYLKALVEDDDNDVFKIEFYIDDQWVGSITDTADYIKVDTLSAGSHILFALAYDLGGAVVPSDTQNIFVNAAPLIFINSPEDQSDYTSFESVIIDFTISDENLQKAEIYVNNILRKSFSSAPFYHELNKLESGIYFINIRAIDSLGLETNARREIEILNSIPVISITRPIDGSVFERGEEILFKASVIDTDDDVYKIAFYNFSEQIGENANIIYETRVRNLPMGKYVIVAKAFDKGGAVVESDSVHISVIQSVSVQEKNSPDKINIFPNPLSGGFLTVELDYNANSSKVIIHIVVCDITGRTLYKHQMKNMTSELRLDYEVFKGRGIYFIYVQTDKNLEVQKLIVQ